MVTSSGIINNQIPHVKSEQFTKTKKKQLMLEKLSPGNMFTYGLGLLVAKTSVNNSPLRC